MTEKTATKLQILSLVLDATRARVLRWEKTESSVYEAMSGGHRFLIIFKYPLLANDDGSDADIAEVHVPGLALTYFNGSEGFDVVLQILAECVAERTAGASRFDEKADAVIALMKGLIRSSGEPKVREP